MRALTLVTPLFVLLLTACGGNSSDDSDRADSKPAPDAGADFDPCELLSEEFLRSQFDIGDAEVSSRSSLQSRYATCLVGWPRPNDAELQAAFQEQIAEYARAKAKGEDVEMPESPRHCELSLTVPAKRFDSPAQAESALDSGLDIVKNGLKTRPKTEEQRAKVVIEPVEGLGNKAAWVVGKNQISVANDRRLFHLTVNVYEDPEANRAKAMELAKLFLKEIR